MKILISISLLILTFLNVHSQSKLVGYPVIGKPFTDFVMDSVYNYQKRTLSYKDFKGKWIIIDFWGEFCSGCIKSFPKVDALQKKYKDKVQFILATQTYEDPNTAISLFKKLKEKFGLTMPVTFDQDFFKRSEPRGMPTQVIINPKGIVEAITYSISEAELIDLFAGKNNILSRSYLVHEMAPADIYSSELPLAKNGKEELNYLYKSVIGKVGPGKGFTNTIIKRNGVEFFNRDLAVLYKYAYIGKEFWGPDDSLYGNYSMPLILKLKDSSLFNLSEEGKNRFSYSLLFSHDVYTDSFFDAFTMADKPKYKKIMQDDLERCFGFKVKIETLKLPYYKLVATPEARKQLRTKGGTEKFGQLTGDKSLSAVNIPVRLLITKINTSSGFPFYEVPVIDETGIDGNIDIDIDAIYFDDYLKELRKNGLDLVLGEREMKAIVIRDMETSNN